MQKPKIILIEDESDIAALIKLQGELAGYKMIVASDGLNGYELVCKEKPDLVILDIMLPGQNGFDICKKIKFNPELKHIPIIVISAKSEETDVVLGLELGADDYVTKPFSPRILLTRVKTVLRRNQEEVQPAEVIAFEDFHINFDRYQITKKGKPIALTLSEFEILKSLIQNKGKVLTRNQLLDSLQNDDAFIVDRNIDVHIAALRKKLGPHFENIETVRGVGYRFRLDE